jgi:hypothetical protein
MATPLSPPLPLGRVFVLESWGAQPEDTVVTFAASVPRVVVLRRGQPDNNLFARLFFPAGAVAPVRGDSVTLTIRPRPGLYGFDLAASGEFRDGAEVTFSYGIHFIAPAGVREAYGSDIRFERFLGVGRLEADSTLVFLESWRPGSDVLTAPLVGSGRYLVAAPRVTPRFRTLVW